MYIHRTPSTIPSLLVNVKLDCCRRPLCQPQPKFKVRPKAQSAIAQVINLAFQATIKMPKYE
jgi:hypothetical protein